MSSKNKEDGKVQRHGAVLGLENLVKRLQREGQPAVSDSVNKKLIVCKQIMEDHAQKTIKYDEGYDRPLADLADQTAKALFKILPKGIFKDATEAAMWAVVSLPMTEARQQETQNRDKHADFGTANHALIQKFWKTFNEAVELANGHNDILNKQFTRDLIQNGIDRV